jgi:Lipocalin-like domain
MSSNNEALVGTWKLVSCFMEDVETKEQKLVWGERPNGYIVLTSGGRWIVIQTAEGRSDSV